MTVSTAKSTPPNSLARNFGLDEPSRSPLLLTNSLYFHETLEEK